MNTDDSLSLFSYYALSRQIRHEPYVLQVRSIG
jgi:hypothetical protein